MRRFLLGAGMLGFAVVAGLLAEPPRELLRGPYQAPLLPRLELLRIVGAGQRSLVADYFWLQTIQSLGGAAGREGYMDVYHYANLTTDLDPEFYRAYSFTAAAIPTNLGRWTWVNTREARNIIEKGLKNFPGDVQLSFQLAYNLSTFFGEHHEAARVLDAVSRQKGAPLLFKEFATRLYAYTGHFDAALGLAKIALGTAEDEETRQLLERRVLEIEREQVLQKIDSAVQAFRTREGRIPEFAELISSGDLSGPLVDPMGGTFFVDEEGKARATSDQRRLDLPNYKQRYEKSEIPEQ